jgi:hypothetical protein
MDVLNTKPLRAKEERARFLEIKRSLISEALGFPSGTNAQREKTTIYAADGLETAFLKPGKEAARKKPNIYDMYPLVTQERKEVTEKFSFEALWEYLLKIFLIHKGTFTKTMTLLYRLCFYCDHKMADGKWRYSPSEKIRKLINDLDTLVLREGFADKFNEAAPLTLLQLLFFADLLAWNEDVKYHAPKGEPYFKNYSESKTGRTNTLLSLVSAPILISKFIEDIVAKTQSGGVINVRLITGVIQKFAKTRGLCVLSDRELLNALAPYLQEGAI